MTKAGRSQSDLIGDTQTMQQRTEMRRELQRLPALKTEADDLRERIEDDTIGGPRQAGRINREKQLRDKIRQLETLDQSLASTCPHRGFQGERRALIRRIHAIDADAVAAQVAEDEADRRTEDERRALEELEEKMAEF